MRSNRGTSTKMSVSPDSLDIHQLIRSNFPKGLSIDEQANQAEEEEDADV